MTDTGLRGVWRSDGVVLAEGKIMTAQCGEMRLYQGQEMEMQTEPLSDFLALRQDVPRFQVIWTACWSVLTIA